MYQQLCTENILRDKALADLTTMVKEYGSSSAATQPYGPSTPTARPRPAMQADVLDADGNLHAADIGITWEDNETFLHGVRVVGPKFRDRVDRNQLCPHHTHEEETVTGTTPGADRGTVR